MLARGGKAQVFTAMLQRFSAMPLPALGTWGITVTAGDRSCFSQGVCSLTRAAIRFATSGATVAVAPGTTAMVGAHSVSVAAFDTWSGGGCDTKSRTALGG